jgi:hypothetical protein
MCPTLTTIKPMQNTMHTMIRTVVMRTSSIRSRDPFVRDFPVDPQAIHST